MLKVDGLYKKFRELCEKIDKNLSPSEQIEILHMIREDAWDMLQQATRDKNTW